MSGVIFQSMRGMDESLRGLIWGPGSPFASFVSIGVSLLFLLTLLMIARMAYRMMTLDGKLDILRFIRPAMVSAVLACWPLVTSTLNGFALPVERYFMGMYEETATEVCVLRERRMAAAVGIADGLREEKARSDVSAMIADEMSREKETEEDGSASEGGFGTAVSEFLPSVFHIADMDLLSGGLLIAESYAGRFVETVIFWLGETYWEVSAFYILLLKNIFLAVLVTAGSVTVACSLLPVWEDGWKIWLGRMVSVSFYGVLAYLVMTVSMYLIRFGLEADVRTLERIGEDGPGLYSLAGYSLGLAGTVSLYLIALVVGGASLNMVPAIASWVFPSKGARAAGEFIRGAMGAAKAAV